MNLLSAVAPALREIRNPLAGGIGWLLAAWLLFGEELQRVEQSATGTQRSMWDLTTQFLSWPGDIGKTTIFLFVAYIFGSLTAFLVSIFIEIALKRGAQPAIQGWRSSSEIEIASTDDANWLDELQRRRSEGLLRIHLGIPLVVITIIMTIKYDGLWVLGFLPCAALLLQGLVSFRQAHNNIAPRADIRP